LLKPKTALYRGILLFLAGIIVSFFINIQVIFFSIFGVALIVFYELFSKKMGFLGNFVVAFTISIAFLYGGAAVGDLIRPGFYTIITFFLMLGREILLDVRDFEGDKKTRSTLPVRIGRIKATYLGVLSLFICVALLFYPGIYIFDSIWYLILIIPFLFTTLYASVLPLIDVENSARTTDILRFSMIDGIMIFVLLIVI
jgi:4-hydroxybenzoate polyprenyltransferase